MTGNMDDTPLFDLQRRFYVGLNKVSDNRVAGKHSIADSTYSASMRAKFMGAISPAGASAAAIASGNLESGVKSTPLSDNPDRSQLLAIAKPVLDEISINSLPVDQETNFEPGRDYFYCGAVRYAIKTHDDFREESQLENAPRLALWLIEIPDTLPAENAQSVTWVVLSGTATGQLKTVFDGGVSDYRGGSQTEHLFELMMAKTEGYERVSSDNRWLRDPYYALAARNLLSRSEQQHVETVFVCLEVHDCPTAGDDVEVSYLDWGPASTGREVAVSRVVLGTPYFVQFPQPTSQGRSNEYRSLRGRLKDYLGINR